MRRHHHAARAVAVVFLALVLASLLNARGLRKTAETQEPGLGRDVALAVTRPLVSVSRFLYLDRPRREIQDALGRQGYDRIDTRVLVPDAEPPPAPPIVLPPPPTAPQTTAPRTDPAPHPRAKPRPQARPKPRPVLRPAFSPARPLRVWVAGDSLVQVPGQSLERIAGTRGPVRVVGLESRVATGLGRPELYNWYARFAEVIAQVGPRAVVLSFGSNDDHDYMSGVPDGVTLGPLGSPSWSAEYRRRVAGVTRAFTRAGVYVIWLGLPIASGEGRNRGFRSINRILDDVAREFRGKAAYLDMYKRFQDGRRHFAQYLPNARGRLVRMRASDGVHYAPAAGDVVARAVLERLGKVFVLRRR